MNKIDIAVSWINQWKDILELLKGNRFNWFNFTPIQLEYEHGGYKGKYVEFTLILMGLGAIIEIYEVKSREEFSEFADGLLKDLGIDNPEE